MQDSGKAMQEKFALTRELNRIKPELEHLQSQLTSYQTTVADRNDLRRQLDSLEVELENEKRSRQRLQSKDDDTATAELKSRLEKAEQKLTTEKKEHEKTKKEHEKVKREHQRELAAANAENERLEERISSLKEKSKSLQAELKEAREQLDDAQSELISNKPRPVSRGGEDKPRRAVTLAGDVGKKRRAPEMNFEAITIQTPGNDIVARERPTKKRGADKAALGEKSVFSITPFLNRNKSLTDDSGQEESSNNVSAEADPEPMSDGPVDQGPPSEPEEEEEEEEAPKPKVAFKSTVSFKSPAKAAKPRGRPPKATPLGDSTPAKTNRVMKSRGTPKIKSIPNISVDKSADDSSATDQENVPVATSKKTTAVLQPKVPEGEVKKKKRKLLGAANTTLFDDDDGEAVVQAKPPPTAGRRTRAVLGGGVRNAFAAGTSFSPLKRDRRGVNASFLG